MNSSCSTVISLVSSKAAKVNGERTVDRAALLAPDHLTQAQTLRPADLERQVSPSEPFALGQVFVADVDSAEDKNGALTACLEIAVLIENAVVGQVYLVIGAG